MKLSDGFKITYLRGDEFVLDHIAHVVRRDYAV